MHKAVLWDTEAPFTLHAWCASIDAASAAPANRCAMTAVFASRKRLLKRTIVEQLAVRPDNLRMYLVTPEKEGS